MAKLFLEFEEDYSYSVLALVTTVKNHRICWILNRLLSLQLKRVEDISIYTKSGISREHACFTYFDENFHIKYRLIENKRGTSRFLPEVGNADYFLVIDHNDMIAGETIRRELNKASSIQLVFEVNLNDLKEKQNILLAA